MKILRREQGGQDSISGTLGQPAANVVDETLSDLPPLLRRVLLARGIADRAEVDHSLSALAPPSKLKGIDSAVALLIDVLERKGRVVVVGDFDVDGASSCAVAVRTLEAMGFPAVRFLVPNRFEYGYGLTPDIVELAAPMHPDLLITVDNGISSVEGVAAANALNIPVLVTDHHLPGDTLPDAAAIVNPNQPGCDFPSKALAGVGVMFYLAMALRSELRQRGWFAKSAIAEPNLAEYLDLVALGTVADVVPLDHNNRVLVEQGLRRIRSGRSCIGIRAILDVAGCNAANLTATDLGFVLGPRLNAAGRLDDMSLGVACLLASDPSIAHGLAEQLDTMNRDRRSIESGMQAQADTALQRLQLDSGAVPTAIALYDESWHQGVVGIVASRVKECYHRPVICFAKEGDRGETLKGSARSITGFHIRDALDRIASTCPGLVDKFGGHAMAAGLSINASRLDEFAAAFDNVASDWLRPDQLESVILSDGELPAEDMTLANAALLESAMPWGQHFSEPQFDDTFELLQQRVLVEKHLKMVLRKGDNVLDAIAFNIDREIWPNTTVETVRLVYQLSVNRYRGRENLQLIVRYLEPA